MFKPRPYQVDGINKIRQAFSNGAKSVLYCSPTGSGKTFVFSTIALSAMAKGTKVIILTHREELLRQAHTHLEEMGVPHGIIKAGYTPNQHHNIQLASVQTLHRRLHTFKEPNLIITDECAHAVSKTYTDIYKVYPNALHLGVTATPLRLDGKGLSQVFDAMVKGLTTKQLIDMEYLSDYVLYGVPNKLDLSKVTKRMGDYVTSELNDLLDTPKITGNAVEHYRKYCLGKPAVAFCVSIKHAEDVAEQFRLSGITSISIDGKLNDKERERRLSGLKSGEYCVLTSCDLISEGFDLPAITAAILLRPTMSLSLYLQQVGRALRKYEGKDKAYIFDHVDNFKKHGLPDDLRQWSLDGMKPKTKQELKEDEYRTRQCPVCYFVHPPAPICPECGYEYTGKERKTLEQVEGELQAINDQQENQKRWEEYEKKKKIWSCKTLEDLKATGKELGYNPYWAIKRWEWLQSKRKQA